MLQTDDKSNMQQHEGRSRCMYLNDCITHICQGDFAVPIHIQCFEGLWNLFWWHEELQVHGHNEVSAIGDVCSGAVSILLSEKQNQASLKETDACSRDMHTLNWSIATKKC